MCCFYRTLKGGTVFRVPDFDDVTDDVTSGSSPALKQRLTFSPGGGAKRPGTGTPLSGGKSASPEVGVRSPQCERRSARKVSDICSVAEKFLISLEPLIQGSVLTTKSRQIMFMLLETRVQEARRK